MTDVELRIWAIQQAALSAGPDYKGILDLAERYYNFVTDVIPDEFCDCEDCEPSFNF